MYRMCWLYALCVVSVATTSKPAASASCRLLQTVLFEHPTSAGRASVTGCLYTCNTAWLLSQPDDTAGLSFCIAKTPQLTTHEFKDNRKLLRCEVQLTTLTYLKYPHPLFFSSDHLLLSHTQDIRLTINEKRGTPHPQ